MRKRNFSYYFWRVFRILFWTVYLFFDVLSDLLLHSFFIILYVLVLLFWITAWVLNWIFWSIVYW